MNTRLIVINVAAAIAILSVPAVASAQGTGGRTKGTAGERRDDTGARKGKAAEDEKGPLEGTSAEAAARADAEAPQKSPAVPEVAPDTPAARFGARGQIVVSSDVGLSVEYTSLSGADGSTTTVRLHPALDYFVMDNLSIGGFVGLDYLATEGGNTTAFSIGPRIGYNIAFADRFSVWPKVGLSFASTNQSIDITAADGSTTSRDTNNTALALNLFVPVMFHPVEHFFFGFGPALDVDLTGDNKATTFGGRLSIGGWF